MALRISSGGRTFRSPLFVFGARDGAGRFRPAKTPLRTARPAYRAEL